MQMTPHRLLVLFGALLLTAGSAAAACDGSTMSGGNHCLFYGAFSTTGGNLAGATTQLAGTSMFPFQGRETEAERQIWYTAANDALNTGTSLRNSLMFLTETPGTPDCGKQPTAMAPWERLLCRPEDDFEDLGKVGFPDADRNGEPDACLITNMNLDGLLRARDTFAYQAASNWAPPGSSVAATRIKLLQTIRVIADLYLLVADEFLIDATEFRVSNQDTLRLDQKLDQQRMLSTKARLCYQGAVEAFLYGFSPAVGTNIYAADLFGTPDTQDGNLFTLFNLAVSRWSAAWREEAAKRRARGISPSATDQGNARERFKTDLAGNATGAYLLTAAGASRQGTSFASNGGPQLRVALDLLRTLAAAEASGLNPLGYDDRFIPMVDASVLLGQARSRQANADQSWQAFQSYRRDFDLDIDRLQEVLTTEATSALKAQLATLTGVPTNDGNFDARVAVAGGDFFDCGLDLDNSAFVTCMTGKAAGTLASRYYDMHRARQQWRLADQRKRNLLEQIAAEVRAHGDRLTIENAYNTAYHATLAAYLEAMGSARSITVSEDKYEKKDKTDGDTTKSKGKTTTTTTSYSLRNDSLHLQITQEGDLQDALRDYRIKLDGVQYQGTIQALNRQIIEQEIEIGLAIQQENAVALDFGNLMAQRDDLIFQRGKASEHAGWSAGRIMARAAEVRILRSRAALQFQSDFNQAVRFSYLTAKALEYWHLQPLVDIPIGGRDDLLNLTDLYKMQDVTDLDRFNDNLEDFGTCPWGSIQSGTVEISMIWDHLGLTNPVVDARTDCGSRASETERNSCRREWRQTEWQRFVSEHRSADPVTGRQRLRIPFSTSLGDDAIAWMGLQNLKAWDRSTPVGCGPVGSNGLAVLFKINQSGNGWQPKVTLTQAGATSLLRADRINGDTVYEYVPVGRYLNMQGTNTDEMYRTTAVLTDDRNGLFVGPAVDPSKTWSNGLKGRSPAASNWVLEVQDVGRRDVIDWTRLEDIEIHIDVIGSSR